MAAHCLEDVIGERSLLRTTEGVESLQRGLNSGRRVRQVSVGGDSVESALKLADALVGLIGNETDDSIRKWGVKVRRLGAEDLEALLWRWEHEIGHEAGQET